MRIILTGPVIAAMEHHLWTYFFTHRNRVSKMTEELDKKFKTFVHKSVIYHREGNKIRKEADQTVSGLIFVYGNHHEIQSHLDCHYSGHHLVKDPITGEAAQIREQEMNLFMQIATVSSRSIRFLTNDLDYYSEGHPKIRVTSGILAGMDGYIIRIARDRCLVTQIGNMTVAIGGVHKDDFENIEDYLRTTQATSEVSDHTEHGLMSMDIERHIIRPQSDLDLMASEHYIRKWLAQLQIMLRNKDYSRIVVAAITLLDRIGKRYNDIDFHRFGSVAEIRKMCSQIYAILLDCQSALHSDSIMHQRITSNRESLKAKYTFLPLH